jgi:hypothetical protein
MKDKIMYPLPWTYCVMQLVHQQAEIYIRHVYSKWTSIYMMNTVQIELIKSFQMEDCIGRIICKKSYTNIDVQ